MTYQSTRGIENIDVKEGNQSEAELCPVLRNVPLLHRQGFGNLVEVDDLPEEIEGVVTDRRIGEIRKGRGAGPRDDADEGDAGDDGGFHAIHHEDDGQDTAGEDAHPHGRVAHLGGLGAEAVGAEPGLRAAREHQRRGLGALQYAEPLAVGEADDGQEEADADARGELDGPRDRAREPLAQAEQRQREEDEALHEGRRQSHSVGRVSRTVESDDVVREVCV